MEIRGLFRSHSHLPIWEVMEKAGIWEQNGLKVSFEFCDSSEAAEKALFGGDVDFVSGNHISPYLLVKRGKPIVCLSFAFEQRKRSAGDDVSGKASLRAARQTHRRHDAGRFHRRLPSSARQSHALRHARRIETGRGRVGRAVGVEQRIQSDADGRAQIRKRSTRSL